ncbi:MAG: hypothetical protein KJ041_03990, partial [Gammaproteobacteria bacterium]|nr:hypothetical protein [Gammaproteobacteria bacterium]
RSRFAALERDALRPLPMRAYEFGEWKKAKVHPDYHIEVGRAYYSVPYALIGERVDVRLTAHGVEVFHAGRLIAAHPRTRAPRSTVSAAPGVGIARNATWRSSTAPSRRPLPARPRSAWPPPS